MKTVVCAKVCGGEINEFDKCAVECALRLCDDVTVISMGPDSAKAPLEELTRLGVKVILLCDKAFAGSDTLATAYILSLALKRLEYDLIICGRQTTDGDTAQVGPCLAATMGMGVITNVMEILSADGEISCRTRTGEESLPFPSLITVERINTLRFPKMRSKVSEVTVWDSAMLGADISRCGFNGSPTKVLEVFENKSGRRNCKFIKRDELLPLIEHLKNESCEETAETVSPVKFKNVWIIGDKVQKAALKISETVTLITETDPKLIAQRAQIEKPQVILWNADLWGRKNAPITAALLQTGLCADCVKLETDGETLYMYRPAKSGNVTAKIKCVTYPQMATVRTVEKSSDIIVSGGRGVKDSMENLKSFAEKIGAQMCVSRGLVDMGAAPYEMQVGLTGKTVSPKIYIAAGISGAVHHTCAIENAQTIIAVNPDKDARIFEYADYGIIDKF